MTLTKVMCIILNSACLGDHVLNNASTLPPLLSRQTSMTAIEGQCDDVTWLVFSSSMCQVYLYSFLNKTRATWLQVTNGH